MKEKGFAAYEVLGFGMPNLSFGGHDAAMAKRLVAEGSHRWAWCHGGTLALVPTDYALKMNERFLRETSTGFEVIEDLPDKSATS